MNLKKYRVPKKAITEQGLRRLLKDAFKDSSMSSWAEEKGITPQSVSAFFRKTQGAGLQIPTALGLRPQTIFMPVDEPLITHANPPRRPAQKPTSKVDHTLEPVEKKHKKVKNEKKEAKKRLKARRG